MQDSIDLLVAHGDDINRAEQAELLFHRIMWRAARNSSLQAMMLGLEQELAPIHDMMLRTPEDYAAGIELHTATLAALKRSVADVLQRTPHRQTPPFLLAGAH